MMCDCGELVLVHFPQAGKKNIMENKCWRCKQFSEMAVVHPHDAISQRNETYPPRYGVKRIAADYVLFEKLYNHSQYLGEGYCAINNK
jgi:hypothetical protein